MKRQKPEEQISQHCQTIQSYSAGTSNNKRAVDLTLRLETHLIISINYALVPREYAPNGMSIGSAGILTGTLTDRTRRFMGRL